jgi:DNA-binding Xre family transcriptional regulator
MIAIKLREAMEAHRRRTGERLTYEKLSERTGIAKQTLHTIGSRDDYNATLELIEKLCRALAVTPGDLLELIDDLPQAGPIRGAGQTKKKKP